MKIDLRGNAVAAAFEQVVVGGAFFIFYGVLIRIAGADLVGVLSLVLVLASLGAMTSTGFASALSHFVPLFEGRGDRNATVRCIETTLLCTAALYAAMLGAAYYPFMLLVSAQAGIEHAALVRELIIPATLHVFLLGVGATTTLALTALHKSSLRFWASLAGAGVGLGILLWGAPRFGVVAGLWGLAAQSGTIALVSWVQLTRILPELPLAPSHLNRPMAKDLWRLGLNMQAQALLVSGLEPVTRLLLGQYGSLAAVAYFSMASRFVIQIRALIYAGAQPLLSAFSHTRTNAPDAFAALYRRSGAVLGFIAIVALSAAAGASPFIGEIWIGQRRDDFVIFTVILTLGWLINTVTLAAYFNAYSLGRMTCSLIGHVLLFALNVALGFLFGLMFGATGVVAGMGLALLASGLFMGIGNGRHAPAGGGMGATPWNHIIVGLCAMLAVAAAIIAYYWLRQISSPLVAGILSGVAWLIVTAPALYFHPARKFLFAPLRAGSADRGWPA